MSMKEKLEAKKLERFKTLTAEKDLENKNRELKDAKDSKVMYEEELKNIEAEKKLFIKISNFMLEHYGKLPEKYDNCWEIFDDYWTLMKEKQKLDNKRKLAEFEAQLRIVKKKIHHLNDQIDGLKKALLVTELEVNEEGDKNE